MTHEEILEERHKEKLDLIIKMGEGAGEIADLLQDIDMEGLKLIEKEKLYEAIGRLHALSWWGEWYKDNK